MIGPIVVATSDKPLFGPGKATEPNPMNNNMIRGPRSRAGLNDACEMRGDEHDQQADRGTDDQREEPRGRRVDMPGLKQGQDHQEQDGRAENLAGQALEGTAPW